MEMRESNFGDSPFDDVVSDRSESSAAKKSKPTTSNSSTQTAFPGEAPTGTGDPGEGTSSESQDQQGFARHDLVNKTSLTKAKSRFQWMIKNLSCGVPKIGTIINKSDLNVPAAFFGMTGSLGLAFGESGMRYLIVSSAHPQAIVLHSESEVCLNLSTEQSDDPSQAGSFVNHKGILYYFARVSPMAQKKIRIEGGGGIPIHIYSQHLNSLN